MEKEMVYLKFHMVDSWICLCAGHKFKHWDQYESLAISLYDSKANVCKGAISVCKSDKISFSFLQSAQNL